MNLARSIAAFAAALLIAGASLEAQVPTSTSDRIPSSSDPSRSDVARSDRAFRDLVDCVIRYQPGRTRNLLDTIPGSHAEADILVSFDSRMETCYDFYQAGGRAMTYYTNLLRGAVAEAYYHRDFPGGIMPAGEVAPERAAAWTQPRPDGGRVSQMELLHAMARCATTRLPAAVAALLRTVPLGAEERAAFGRLQADLSACLDSGVELGASRQSLRGLLAEAAFHYGTAQRESFAGAAGAARGE